MSIHDHIDRLHAARTSGTQVGSFPEGAASSRSTEALGLLAVTWGAIGGFMYLKNMARERARAKR